MWTQEGEQGLHVHSVEAESPRRSSFRASDRVVESPPRDLRAPLQPGRSSKAEQAPPPQPRILYIEDNPESRALVRNVLEARGFDVLEASDGIAGIDLAISAHPDLILCDIEMPGIDGYETATRLRSYRGLDQCPIVVLTSHGDRGLSLSIGCDGYIEKPIDVARFPGQLREFLKGKREKVRGPEERRYLREYSQSLVERLEATVRELTAANSRLRAGARSKTEFMQNLSHELATPLTPITGYLKILKSGKAGGLTDSQQKIIESMQTASERLSRTIDNLVDFATLESGGYSIHRAEFDAVGLAKAVGDEERPKAGARRQDLGGESAQEPARFQASFLRREGGVLDSTARARACRAAAHALSGAGARGWDQLEKRRDFDDRHVRRGGFVGRRGADCGGARPRCLRRRGDATLLDAGGCG